MSKRFLFSMNAGFATQSVLKVLASARMITATSCIVVCTDDELVAALLAKLETSERIETAVESVSATGSIADVQYSFPWQHPKSASPGNLITVRWWNARSATRRKRRST
jgi:hypothetical protein